MTAVAMHVEARAIYQDWDHRTHTLPIIGFTVDESGHGQALILTAEGTVMPAATNASRDWEFQRIDIEGQTTG